MDDEIRDGFHVGRRAMIAAFADLTTRALRAGVGWDVIDELHGRFFDGNVAVKDAFRVAALLAEVHAERPSRPAASPPGVAGDVAQDPRVP